MKRLLAGLLFIAGHSFVQASSHAATIDDVLLLAERGVSNETILVFLETRKIGFSPDTDDVNRLKAAGIGEDVIRYLLRQTVATSAAPPNIEQKIIYMYPYPDYYYNPYYFGTSLYLGISHYPHTWFQPHHSFPIHHNTAAHFTHNVNNSNLHGASNHSSGNHGSGNHSSGNHGTTQAVPAYNVDQPINHNAGNTHKPRDTDTHKKEHHAGSKNSRHMPSSNVRQHNNGQYRVNQGNGHTPSHNSGANYSGRSHSTVNHNSVSHSGGYNAGHSSLNGTRTHGRGH